MFLTSRPTIDPNDRRVLAVVVFALVRQGHGTSPRLVEAMFVLARQKGHPLAVSRFGIASDEWPVVVFGACLGITWTIVSLNVVFMFPDWFAVHTPLDLLRVLPVLPAFGSVAVAATLYAFGSTYEIGLALGALLTTLACAVGPLLLARRS